MDSLFDKLTKAEGKIEEEISQVGFGKGSSQRIARTIRQSTWHERWIVA